jgi:N-glycosylase/DNA lyase
VQNDSVRALQFDLALTVECGQLFRWTRRDGGYRIAHGERVFDVRQEGDELVAEGADDAFLTRFFALDHPIEEIDACVGLPEFPRGLRIIRQDPWDCMVGFVLSAASNIPRIRLTMERLGPLADLGDARRLRRLGAGFRAPYLVEAQRWARAGGLGRVAAMDDEAARAELTSLPGIARKVADCILLYAFQRYRAFPIDVWVRRAMIRRFFGGRRAPDEALQERAAVRFGRWAGYAQQTLFIAERAAGRA